MEREESFRSTSESEVSSVYDLPHPLEYYEAHDGRRCMEWEEFHSYAGTDWESDDTGSQISRSNSMASQVGLNSTAVAARELEELMRLRKKVLIWLMHAKKEMSSRTAVNEAESWLLEVSKVINLTKRRNDVLSIMFPWRKPSREGLKHLIRESIMMFKTISVAAILSVLEEVPVEFSYREIAIATDNFSQGKVTRVFIKNEVTLRDGFFIAYDCQLRGQRATVKRFYDMKEFLTEVEVLTHLNHPNVVRFIGYCMTENPLLLVHEYMENQDLGKLLLNNDSELTLSWDNRVQIALDTALALDYIHEGTPRVYIHCHIKPGTILLDGSLRAKIADFDRTVITEPGREPKSGEVGEGFVGFLAPEYRVSTKVDVFAFGVLLFQLISAKMAFTNLIWMFNDVFHDELTEISRLVDPRLELDYPIHAVYLMAKLAIACTQKDPEKRPTMGDAAAALRSISSQD